MRILICLAVLIALTGIMLIARPQAEETRPTIIPLLKDNYAEILLREIGKAETSIQVALYNANYRPDLDYAIENKVLRALVKAHHRGIKVRIILDRNVSRAPGADPNKLEDRSLAAAAFLKKNKVPVFFDDHQTLTHCKLIVFDNTTVILGSANWTYSGLKKNIEAGVLIKDRATAKTYVNMIDAIKLEPRRETIP